MSLSLWIGVITGGAAVAQIIAVVRRRVRGVGRQDGERRKQVADAAKGVREKALLTLKLKREEKAMLAEMRELATTIDKGEAHVARVHAAEEFIYVSDERKSPGDQAFIAAIAHPDFNRIAKAAPADVLRSWAGGRQYLIWAANQKMAQAKAQMRHPAEKGYVVGGVAPYTGGPDDL